MDTRVLVFELDLVSALFDAQRRTLLFSLSADHGFPLLVGEGIAHVADAERKVARGLVAEVEMLVELAVAGRTDAAVLPVEPLEILVALVPQQRIAVAGDADDVRAGAVAMRLLVGAGGHFRHVAGEDAVGEDELDVARAGAAVRV